MANPLFPPPISAMKKPLWPMSRLGSGPMALCAHSRRNHRVGRLAGKTTRPGLCKCYACQKPFTVKIGTVFEATHAPLRLWLQAIYLMCSSKKGISTRQLQRILVRHEDRLAHGTPYPVGHGPGRQRPAGWRWQDCGGGRNFQTAEWQEQGSRRWRAIAHKMQS